MCSSDLGIAYFGFPIDDPLVRVLPFLLRISELKVGHVRDHGCWTCRRGCWTCLRGPTLGGGMVGSGSGLTGDSSMSITSMPGGGPVRGGAETGI